MNLTDIELESIELIINEVLENNPKILKEVGKIGKTDINTYYQNDIIFWADEIIREPRKSIIKLSAKDRFKPYFENTIPSRINDFGLFYHSLKYEYALNIIKNKSIQLSALSYLWDNDHSEYTEFNKRYPFNRVKNQEELEKEKDKIFIFCFSDSFRDERSWKLYGNDESGLCIGFRFTKFSDDESLKDLYSIRNVFYDSGYDFDFINEIQAKLKKKLKKQLYFDGLSTISKFYKKNKYKWEKELRLCLDYDFIDYLKDYYKKLGLELSEKMDLTKKYPIQYDDKSDRYFITINLINDLFSMEIDEIICGKNISDEQIIEIKNNLPKNTKVWRRI